MKKYQNTISQPSLINQYLQPFRTSPKYQPKSSNPQIQHQIYLLQSHYSIQIQKAKFQLQKLISQNNRLQLQLRQQKDRSFQLIEIKRRLQQQLKRMEFQMERMSSYEIRINKQTNVRSQNLLSQNLRLNKKVDQLLKQLTQTKENHRIHLIDHNNLRNNYTFLQKQKNRILLELNQVRMRFDKLHQEITSQHEISLKLKSKIKEQQNTIKTMPSSNFQQINSGQVFKNQEIKEQLSSPMKLRAVKSQEKFKGVDQLNNQFYDNYHQIYKQSFSPDNGKNQKFKELESKKQELPQQDSPNIFMLRTYQKNQLSSQLTALRVEVINQLMDKYYQKSVQIARKKHSNCLKEFIILLGKFQNIKALGKMAENYLQARKTVQEECGQTFQKAKISQDWVGSMFSKVKQQSKKNNKADSFYLTIFRLLTIYSKIPSSHGLLPEIQHTVIKNLYKLKQKIIQ